MKKVWSIIITILALGLIWSGFCLYLINTKSHEKVTGYFESILVLGSMIEGHDINDAYPAPQTKARLDAAVELAKQEPEARIIVSGAKGFDEPVTEASAMAKYLKSKGIPENKIIQEDKARDTSQNLKYSKPYMKGRTVIVTNDFHLYRSLYLAKKQGLTNIEGEAAPTLVKNPLLWTGFYGHEVLGLSFAFISGKG